MDTNTNALNWFEIPVTNMDRAKKFYEAIFSIEMPLQSMIDMNMAFFPYEMGNGKVSGGLVQSQMHIPSKAGAVVYLNADPDLQNILNKIEKSGGKVVMPKTQISPEVGFMAFFEDTEGNKVALHSNG